MPTEYTLTIADVEDEMVVADTAATVGAAFERDGQLPEALATARREVRAVRRALAFATMIASTPEPEATRPENLIKPDIAPTPAVPQTPVFILAEGGPWEGWRILSTPDERLWHAHTDETPARHLCVSTRSDELPPLPFGAPVRGFYAFDHGVNVMRWHPVAPIADQGPPS